MEAPSILSGGVQVPQFLEQQKIGVFSTNALKGLRQLFLTVSWDLHAWHGTPESVLVSLQFRKQHMRRVQGPSRVPCQLKKALQGSKTETAELLGGMEEKSISGRGLIDLSSKQFYDFFPIYPLIMFDCWCPP